MEQKIHKFMQEVISKNSHEKEFLQAVEEVVEVIIPFMQSNERYNNKKLLERMIEPERVIMFRVPWLDDSGNFQVNRGYRVEFNSNRSLQGGQDSIHCKFIHIKISWI